MFGGKAVTIAAAVISTVGCGELVQAGELEAHTTLALPTVETEPTVETASGAADAYTPHVVLAVPDRAAYVRPDVVIKLLFSMPMDTQVSGAALTVVDGDGEPIAGSLHWDVTRMVAAFRPEQPLPEGDYQARVDGEACNTDGVELAQPFATDFQVYQSSGSDKPYAG